MRWALVPPALIACYLLAAILGAVVPNDAPYRDGRPEVMIGLAPGPIHYDFLFPLTPDLRERFAFAEAGGVPVFHPDAEWLSLGWGAEGFYTTVGTYADISLGATWNGIIGDRSVIRIEALGPVAGDIEWIALTSAEYEALLTSIEADFVAGHPVLPVSARTASAFFRSNGRFHLFRTCNVWVAEKLRDAGLPFGRWTPTTYSVRLSLSHFGLVGR